MAEAANPTSEVDDGRVPSAAESDSSRRLSRRRRNSDGDFFFCAATGTDMASICITGLSQVSKGIRRIKMPS